MILIINIFLKRFENGLLDLNDIPETETCLWCHFSLFSYLVHFNFLIFVVYIFVKILQYVSKTMNVVLCDH